MAVWIRKSNAVTRTAWNIIGKPANMKYARRAFANVQSYTMNPFYPRY